MSTTSSSAPSNAQNTLLTPAVTVPVNDDDSLVVVARRHPWRWVGIAAVLVLLAMFVHGLATNPGWD